MYLACNLCLFLLFIFGVNGDYLYHSTLKPFLDTSLPRCTKPMVSCSACNGCACDPSQRSGFWICTEIACRSDVCYKGSKNDGDSCNTQFNVGDLWCREDEISRKQACVCTKIGEHIGWDCKRPRGRQCRQQHGYTMKFEDPFVRPECGVSEAKTVCDGCSTCICAAGSTAWHCTRPACRADVCYKGYTDNDGTACFTGFADGDVWCRKGANGKMEACTCASNGGAYGWICKTASYGQCLEEGSILDTSLPECLASDNGKQSCLVCNRCFCNGGSWGCTRMLCSSNQCFKGSKSEDGDCSAAFDVGYVWCRQDENQNDQACTCTSSEDGGRPNWICRKPTEGQCGSTDC